MNISIEEKKEEAIKRMKLLGIFNETIRQFKEDGYVSISEPPYGAFYWVEDDDLEKLKAWEIEHNALVYCVVRSYFDCFKMDSYLFVGDNEEEWADDIDLLKSGETFAYVCNQDAPDLSEFGYIGIAKTAAAGLRRTW